MGPLSATGIHLVDLSIALFGRPVRSGRDSQPREASLQRRTLSLTIGFADGATAMLVAVLATPFTGRLALLGSRAGWRSVTATIRKTDGVGRHHCSSRRNANTAFYPPHPAVRDNLEAFGKAALGLAPYPVSIEEMKSVNMRTFEAITRSASSGRIEEI